MAPNVTTMDGSGGLGHVVAGGEVLGLRHRRMLRLARALPGYKHRATGLPGRQDARPRAGRRRLVKGTSLIGTASGAKHGYLHAQSVHQTIDYRPAGRRSPRKPPRPTLGPACCPRSPSTLDPAAVAAAESAPRWVRILRRCLRAIPLPAQLMAVFFRGPAPNAVDVAQRESCGQAMRAHVAFRTYGLRLRDVRGAGARERDRKEQFSIR